MNQDKYITATRLWIEKTIIGYNFCPFARKPFNDDVIHYEVVDDKNTQEQLHSIVNEFHRLDQNNQIETTVIIFPTGLESYFDYLDFLDIANNLLYEEGYEGVYQLASFHPDYSFSDVDQDDASNYTNRSPFPLIHVIREASLEAVLSRYKNAEQIPEDNIQLAREKGRAVFEDILSDCRKPVEE